MEASELRIGNWVKDKHTGTQCTVDAIDLYGVAFTEDKSYDDFQRTIEPVGIRLTEELLMKFGFEKDDISWHDGFVSDGVMRLGKKYFIADCPTGWLFNIITWDNGQRNHLIATIRHLHQLQNLYFALTGEELLHQHQDNKPD